MTWRRQAESPQMSALHDAGTLLRDPTVRKRYLKWLTCKHLFGRPPYVDLPKGRKISPALRFNDYHAIATQHPGEPEFVLLNTLLACVNDAVFIDVGANIGTMSVLAHSTGHASRIIALEPNHRYCAAWHLNMSLNGVDRATLVQAAAGDVCADVAFRIDPAFPLNSKIDVGVIYPTPLITQVKMITIDSLCEVMNVGPGRAAQDRYGRRGAHRASWRHSIIHGEANQVSANGIHRRVHRGYE
jgi:FkbM family methyltransferase